LLLDPDRLDALVLAVDTLKQVIAPENFKVVATGTFVDIATFAPAAVTAPDGSIVRLQPDQSGRVRFRTLQVGPYKVQGGNRDVAVYANYYDAAESDLTSPALSSGPSLAHQFVSPTHHESYPQPLAPGLIAAAIFLMLAESFLIAQRAIRWGVRHV
jgi:hypothetical protein